MQVDAIVTQGDEISLEGTDEIVRPLNLPSEVGSTAQVNFIKRGIERDDLPIQAASNFSPQMEQYEYGEEEEKYDENDE